MMLVEALYDRFVNTNSLLRRRHRPRLSLFIKPQNKNLLLQRMPLFFLGALETTCDLLLVYMANTIYIS